MAHKVSYEWAVEESDAHGDIFSVDHAAALTDALELKRTLQSFDGRQASVEIALVRHEGSEAEGETARHYAYLRDDGTLPENFDDGPPVPQRFHKEAAAVKQSA